MAELEPRPNGAPDEGERAREAPAPPAAADAPAKPLTALFGAPEPGDDTPTIISKNAPGAARSERSLAENLRGRCLAHFELIEPIGVGGMAAVIRAHDAQLDRTVALKVLPPEMAADPENVRRFQQEARAAARLDHENVARVYYCGQDQGLLFIAFEFVEGQNLRAILERRGRLPVTEAIHYVLQIATGLAHAAERGVVHRDIKPSNIIITPSGRAKLVDMGLARSLGPQPDGALTQSGVTLGTFDYISPEQALEPRDADVRSDIYSLGCTLYHMLTGQPPVPEGTAAKKLHCHQHVPPVDPRQLNPAIPDDVAATLARMMAKDPRERYQQPEQLVQHLLVLAQRVGAPASGPDGVLFVDAPLPSPPQMRPAFLMAAAVVLLVSFIVFLGSAPGPSGSARSNLARSGPRTGSDAPAVVPDSGPAKATQGATAEKLSTPQPAPAREPVWFTPANAQELAEYLESHDVAHVILAKDLDLQGVPLTFAGHSLEIKAAADSRVRPTIRLDYPAGVEKSWALITIRGDGRVSLSGLRFVVNATQADDILMAAIDHRGTGLVTATECEFVQLNLPDPGPSGRLSSVRVQGVRGEGEVPRLNLVRCYFAPGQEAVTLIGTAAIDARDCAFAPHTAALFHLRGRGKQESKLEVNHCSALLGEGAAFRLTDGPACNLNVYKSIFSRPESNSARSAEGALVLQTGRLAREFEYGGNENCYHNIKVYRVRATDGAGAAETITTFKDFNLKKHVQGELSFELSENPWQAEDPLALLAKSPQKAFRLKAELPQLWRGEDSPQVVGVNASPWGNLYEGLTRPEDKKPEAVAGRKVVDPTRSLPGSYATLEEAITAARSGDDIRIRTNNRLRVSPIRFQQRNLTLTIQADDGYRPVLTPSRSPDLTEDSLFRLIDGQLILKGLTLQLEPTDGPRHQSVVTILGPAQCTLQDCLITLNRGANGGESIHLAVVTLADPSTAMKMETTSSRTLPDVDVLNCFIRGDGDLLAVRASRPLDLEVTKSLVVLRNGSLLSVEGAGEDVSGQSALQNQKVAFNQVTAYLGEHLLALKAVRHARGLLRTDVTASGCLFAAANGKPLVHLEGTEGQNAAPSLLTWKSEQPNLYSGFSPMLEQAPRSEDTMPMPYDQQRWRTFAGETEQTPSSFQRVQFTAAPGVEESWAKATIPQFRVKPDTDLPRCGADIDELAKRLEDGAAGAAPQKEEE